jgi:hypothetical protein
LYNHHAGALASSSIQKAPEIKIMTQKLKFSRAALVFRHAAVAFKSRSARLENPVRNKFRQIRMLFVVQNPVPPIERLDLRLRIRQGVSR